MPNDFNTIEQVQVKAPPEAEEMIGGKMLFTVNNRRFKDIEQDNDVYIPTEEEAPNLLEIVQKDELSKICYQNHNH